jgi:hypothetical protein
MIGIFGSILFIMGDLLYNHIPGSKDNPALKMSRMPGARLINAGTLGLVGCWFYAFASLHLYLAFRPAGEVFAFIFLLAYASASICFGIGHTAYFAIAAGAQAAAQLGSDAEADLTTRFLQDQGYAHSNGLAISRFRRIIDHHRQEIIIFYQETLDSL